MAHSIPPKSPPRMPSSADLSEYTVGLRRGVAGEKGRMGKVMGGDKGGEGKGLSSGEEAGLPRGGLVVPTVLGPSGTTKQTRPSSPSDLGVDERTWDASVPGTPLPPARGMGHAANSSPGTPFSEARTTPGKCDGSDGEVEVDGEGGGGEPKGPGSSKRGGERGVRVRTGDTQGGDGVEEGGEEKEEGHSPRPVNPVAKILSAAEGEGSADRGQSSRGESSGGGSGRVSSPLQDVTNVTQKPKAAPRKRSEADRLALWTWEPEAARQRDRALREKLEREREESRRLLAELEATKARKAAIKARKAAAQAKKAANADNAHGGEAPSEASEEAAAAKRRASATPLVNVEAEEAKSVAGKCDTCSVCNVEGKDAAECSSQDELLVTCGGGCGTRVHAKCFGYPLEGRPPKQLAKRGGWTCERCTSYRADAPGGLFEKREQCALCPRRDGAMKRTTDWRWAHLSCALFIPEVFFRGSPQGREPVDMLQVPRRRFKVSCELCKRHGEGATVVCSEAGCGESFHITCNLALDNVCEFREETGVVLNFCGRHSAQYRAKIERAGAGGALGWQIVKAKAKDAPAEPATPRDPTTSPRTESPGESSGAATDEITPRRGVGRPRKKARGGADDDSTGKMSPVPGPAKGKKS